MFKSIVVGTDGSETAGQAVGSAIQLAVGVGATLDVVSAYQPVSDARLKAESKEAPEDMQYAIGPSEEVDVVLQAAAEAAKTAGVEVRTHPREGDPADAILQVAEEQGADSSSSATRA